jgi:hypothetical protein
VAQVPLAAGAACLAPACEAVALTPAPHGNATLPAHWVAWRRRLPQPRRLRAKLL